MMQMKHIEAGKKVLISAPAKEDSVKTIVYGVNDDKLTKEDLVVSGWLLHQIV